MISDKYLQLLGARSFVERVKARVVDSYYRQEIPALQYFPMRDGFINIIYALNAEIRKELDSED